MQEEHDAAKNGEGAVGIVERVRKNAINSEHRERCGQQKGHEPERGQSAAQNLEQNLPRQNGCQSAHDRAVDDMMKEDSPRKPDEPRLDQKSSGRVGKWEIAVGEIAEGNSVGIFEDVAEVPEDRQARILPEGDGGCSK